MASILDPFERELLHRLRQGYSQRMLLLYLQHQKSTRISQASLSRWLSRHSSELFTPITTDDEYEHYKTLGALCKQARPYRRTLARWRGYIRHLHEKRSSPLHILNELKKRGVDTSIRSICRELEQ